MTTQSLISGQSIGTGTNIGNNKFSIAPVTLADTTSAFIINVQLTEGSTGTSLHSKSNEVTVWYTTTMRTVTAANAPRVLAQTARFVTIRPPTGNLIGSTLNEVVAGVVSKDSSLEPKTGVKLHVWVDAPTYTVAMTLDVDVVEVPS